MNETYTITTGKGERLPFPQALRQMDDGLLGLLWQALASHNPSPQKFYEAYQALHLAAYDQPWEASSTDGR